jgi:hypothetical protein
MNKENEDSTTSGAEEKSVKQFFKNIQTDLGISGGTLGVFLNMHSHIRTTQVEYPKNLVVNKNNIAPCGSETIHTYRKSKLRPKLSPELIAIRLTQGLDVCYTIEQYLEDILSNKHITYNEKDGTFVEFKKGYPPIAISVDEFFEGACSTLSNIDDTFTKSYETKLKPGDHVENAPEFTIAFGGIPFNMLEEGIDAFLERFKIRIETVTAPQLDLLTSLFRKIEEGHIFTIDINILLYFFRDVFDATQVNIFDAGCAQMFYEQKQGRLLSKSDAVRVFEGNRIKNPRLGYGGTKRNKKTKKQTKKLKMLNRPN